MEGYRLLAHTADMGIEATGDSAGELFVEAARGLLAIVHPRGKISANDERVVDVTGLDREELLVNWLNEILFLLQDDGFLPAGFEIVEMAGTRLTARVCGESFDPGRHSVEREIKSATYHRLRVEERGGRWRARVYVDL